MAADASLPQPSLTSILQSNIDDLRNLVACRICIRPMYEPYTTQCGHTFCYSCLRQWFDRDHSKKTCPDCRAHVVHQPAPAYLVSLRLSDAQSLVILLTLSKVREITQTFINTAVLLPPGENTADHKRFQREEAEIVENDKANQDRSGGLFNGRFKNLARYRAPIHDAPDGVERCPMCTWELEDGMCNSCGYIDAHEGYPYPDEDEDFGSDARSFSSLELEEILAEQPDFDHLDYESESSGHYRSRRRYTDRLRERAGLPPGPLARRHRPRPASASSAYGSLDDDFSSDESSSPSSSIRDFMVDDSAVDGDADAHSESSVDLEAMDEHTSSLHRSSSLRSDPSEEPSDLHTESGSDSTLITTRRRPRGRRIATSSTEMSDSDSLDITQSSRQSSYHDGDDSRNGGFSPVQPTSEGGGSQNVPIQIDSDSDAPIRRTRRRPTTVSSFSDRDGNSNGGGIQPPPTGMASNSEAADSGSRSPSPGMTQPSEPQTLNAVDRMPSPILVGSSPAGRTLPGRDLSSRMLLPPTRPQRRRIPSGAPARRSGHDGLSASRRSSTQEPSEQRPARSPTGPSLSSPRQTEQRRKDRRSTKRQARARRQQDRQSQGRMNPLGQPQQLAYIGV